jgi:putative sugar O-methyltransferase
MKSTSADSDDNEYPKFCELAASNDDVFKTFKTSFVYTRILEHVNYEQGLQYYKFFKHNKLIIDNLEKFKINDKYGSPNLSNYDFGLFSPSTLRYIKVLSDLTQTNLDGKDVVEIGCGYGGQYTIIRQLFKPKSYTFIDLDPVNKLIKKYIKKLNLDDIEINFYNNNDVPNINADLVISNYAISECIKEVQDVYIENVINNCKKGYITHNSNDSGPKYTQKEFLDIVKHNIKEHPELPKTGQHNVLYIWS